MSQAHIPQPNSQSAAPAETFDSTADAPHGATVSGIGTPGPRGSEVTIHSGQNNSFDITIHRQFIPLDTFFWSIGNQKGELLWWKSIHPSSANPLIAYLSGMYNTWGGSIEYNFKIAGTGFHAGALVFVRIPPNYHPKDFAGSTSWGAFEYVVIDPKTLEVMSVDVIDQRPVMYHYMNMDEKVPNSFGGWIACYVLIPLNTSATGSSQIAVQSFARPGMSFKFGQLIIPDVLPDRQDITHVFTNFLSPGARTGFQLGYPRDMGVQTRRPISSLIAGPVLVQSWPLMSTINFRGARNAGGFGMEWEFASAVYKVRAVDGTKLKVEAWKGPMAMAVPTGAFFLIYTTPDGKITSAGATQPGDFYVADDGYHSLSLKIDTVYQSGTAPLVGNDLVVYSITDKWVTPTTLFKDFKGTTATHTDTMFKIQNKDEVFLFYTAQADDNLIFDLQLVKFYNFLATLRERGTIPTGQAILLNVIDSSTKQILMVVKMYSEGIMTTHIKNANKLIKSAVVFEFISFVASTQPIPVDPIQLMALTLEDMEAHSSNIHHEQSL